MRKLILLLILFCSNTNFAQGKEWHVKPYPDNYNNVAGNDGTTLLKAMCLQYALSGGLNGTQIKGGDIIWLHGDQKSTYNGNPTGDAIYKGHFKSTIAGGIDSKDYITVASYPGEWAVINGNIHNNPVTQNPLIGGNNQVYILDVLGGNVRFENFEITCLNNFSRIIDYRPVSSNPQDGICTTNPPAFNAHEYVGIRHWASGVTTAIRNEFRNLVIRNIPGIAFASWKFTLDSEIYGNIFYNNGIIEVDKPIGCSPLESVPLINSDDNDVNNVRGHQTNIYTQNASITGKDRIIRNNIFLNGYDSGVGIWSAENADEIVRNYVVSKNIFMNNGSPVRDETANMIVHSYGGTLENINIDSNIFYVNSKSSFLSGMLINNVKNIEIKNNLIFNGTTGVEFSETNKLVNFHHNLYAGKYMVIKANIQQFKDPGFEWQMDFNTYYTIPGESIKLFKVPVDRLLALTTIVDHPQIPFFRNTTEYYSELSSSRRSFVITGSSQSFPQPRVIINQNKYNKNLFYVSVYNPQQTNTSANVNFSAFNVPNNKSYRIRDVQNCFATLINESYDSSLGINLPVLNSQSNFESALPIPNNTSYGPAYVTKENQPPPQHSNIDFNTYIIEFECPGLPYELTRENIIDTSTLNLEAKGRITFGDSYTTQPSANITATAENEIRLIQNTWIMRDSKFHARINKNLCSLDLNIALEAASINANPEGIPPSAHSNPLDPPYTESRIRMLIDEETLKLYPNPNNGFFNIENKTSKTISKVVVNRIDSGKLVFSNDYTFQENINIDISQEQKGLFTVQIFFENGDSKVIKIIKK